MFDNVFSNISIIIPMLNEEKNLPVLFESIRRQKLIENTKITDIIAVDNGSVDNSITVAQKYCSAVYSRPNDTIADMRNFGAAHSSGEILIFLDADCVLGEDVIKNVATLLSSKTIAAVGPDGLIPFGKSTWIQETWYTHTRIIKETGQDVEVENLSSGFLAIKGNVFIIVNGFNGALTIGEDTDISRKLISNGLKLIKSNKLKVYNSGHPETIYKFLKREYWHGDSFCHLLIHKKIELLTVYFIINAIALICSLIAAILYRNYAIFCTYIIISSMIPFLKAVKRAPKSVYLTSKLFFIYMLYVNARTLSLFKLK